MAKYLLLHGDCLEKLKEAPDNYVSSVVTDPPYGLSFMGKDWDHGIPGKHFWEEILRVSKPGAHLLAFGGTRTFHRLMVAIEDAGWEIRDTIMWVYGSGFPKSHDVSKAIDKAVGKYVAGEILPSSRVSGESASGIATTFRLKTAPNPQSDAAKKWSGWGTALKPAWEPVIVARKPLEGTVAENVQRYGTGAINIDECRVSYNEEKPNLGGEGYGFRIEGRPEEPNNKGRWPANVIHDGSEEVLELFPNTKSGKMKQHIEGGQYNVYGKMYPRDVETIGDTGSAARFFYCAKASRKEREKGLENLEDKLYARSGGAQGRENAGETEYLQDSIGLNRISKVKNNHPTVKPLELVKYLVKLVTPPEGIVLDPFMGSGTTGIAALEQGFKFLGVEKEKGYFKIAEERIKSIK